jgi:hypothetical protein
MLRRMKTARKAQFKAALSLASMTLQEWCTTEGVSVGHVQQVLRGLRESGKVTAKVDAFIAKHLPSAKQRAA